MARSDGGLCRGWMALHRSRHAWVWRFFGTFAQGRLHHEGNREGQSIHSASTLIPGINLGRRLITSQPYKHRSEFDGSKEVEGITIIACSYASEMF